MPKLKYITMNKIGFLFIAIVLVAVFSCKNKKKTDVSGVVVKQEFRRFDNDFFNCQNADFDNCIPTLEEKYPDFLEIFNFKIINIPGTNNRAYKEYVDQFLTDPLITDTREKVVQTFDESGLIDDINQEINQAFKYYNYYFNEAYIPDIIYFLGGFNQSIILTEEFVGVGLDKYLGAKTQHYASLQIPYYLREKMTPERIVPDVLYAWIESEFAFNDSVDNLLTRMVHQGQVMYLLESVIPEAPDSLLVAYSEKDIKWCKKAEVEMWTYLIEHKLLYDDDFMLRKKFIKPAPFTATFSRQSPGRTGVWIGWQIVRSYMENNPNITIKELMNNNDYQQIFLDSFYKPGA